MTLFAGFVFGTFGISIFNMARKRQKAVPMIAGIAMAVYPYFIDNVYLLWGVGAALLAVGVKTL